MRKIQKSIRLRLEDRRILRREIVRLTLNPTIVALSERVVNWSSGPSHGRLHPSELVVRARERFPKLQLSWAVEGYIVLLLVGDAKQLETFRIEPLEKLPRSVKRFASLSPSEKTRVMERWKQTLQRLRRAI